MSTYNGEAYLSDQINSILAQKQVQVSLLIRDDGSVDATPAILKSYRGKDVRVVIGKNIGVQKSFFRLVEWADSSCDYFAFSDQDDVWLAHKLQRAVEVLEKEAQRGRLYDAQIPLLYAGNVWYASHDLSFVKKQNRKIRKPPSFGNALVENICIGCTQVFNRSLLHVVRGHLPGTGILHDWWMYLSAAYFGTVVFDPNAYVLYRQHSGNQVGMQPSWIRKQAARLGRAGQLKGLLSAQAADFSRVYGAAFGGNNRRVLWIMAGYRQDWRKKRAILKGNAVYRQSRLDQLLYQMLFGIGYL